MALSQAFLKQVEITGADAVITDAQKQAREAVLKARIAEDREYLGQQMAPLVAILDEIARLPPDIEGYQFRYHIANRDDKGVAKIEINAFYRNDEGVKVTGRERTWKHDYAPLTASFQISATREEKGFRTIAWDLDGGEGTFVKEIVPDMQALTDGFVAKWVGRNIPDAARRLGATPKFK